MNNNSDHVVILAGEASGDSLAAHLVTELRTKSPTTTFTGMGGQLMEQAGVDLIINNKSLDIIGFSEVIKKWRPILRVYRCIKQHILSNRPKLVILVDYPGFNLRMSKVAKQAGCQVLYYVSPQIWAWRYQRIKTIKRYVDHMLVLFPFEQTLYKNENFPSTFAGHPMVSGIVNALNNPPQNAPKKNRTIALLPGSRKKEIQLLLPPMIKAANIIHNQYPDIQFIIPLAKKRNPSEINTTLPAYITIVTDNHYQHISDAVCAICTSGTVTLETALLGTPHVIIYKTSWLNYKLSKLLLRTKYIGLSNIVAQQRLAPELLQHEASPQRIVQSTIPFLNNKKHRDLIQNKYTTLLQQFKQHDSTHTAATIAHQLLIE